MCKKKGTKVKKLTRARCIEEKFILPLHLTGGPGSPIDHFQSKVVPIWGKRVCTKTYRQCPFD